MALITEEKRENNITLANQTIQPQHNSPNRSDWSFLMLISWNMKGKKQNKEFMLGFDI